MVGGGDPGEINHKNQGRMSLMRRISRKRYSKWYYYPLLNPHPLHQAVAKINTMKLKI